MYIPPFDADDNFPPANTIYQWYDVVVRVETKRPDGSIIVSSHTFAHHEKDGMDATAKVEKHFTVRAEDQRILSMTASPSPTTRPPLGNTWPLPREPLPAYVKQTFAPAEGLTEVIRVKPTVHRLYITEGAPNDPVAP